MNVLLTGASSFIGAHVAAHLAGAGHTVFATYRRRNAAVERLAQGAAGVHLVELDIAEADAFSRLPAAIDAVVHIAGVSIMPGVTVDDMLACNVTGTRNVLAYALAAGARRLVHASTLSVHGRIAESVVDETTPVRNADLYGASKYLAESLIAAEAGRLPAAAVRLPGVLGPGAHRAWLPTLLERARRGMELAIYNPDAPFNNAAHVDDLARLFAGMIAGAWQGWHAFPVGAAGAISVRAAVERLIAAAGSRSPVVARPAPQPGFTISSAYAEREFGYRAMPIGDMIDRYVAADVRAHGLAAMAPR